MAGEKTTSVQIHHCTKSIWTAAELKNTHNDPERYTITYISTDVGTQSVYLPDELMAVVEELHKCINKTVVVGGDVYNISYQYL